MRALAKTVGAQSGWKFRAICANPATEQPDRIAKPTPAQIDAGLQEIEVLADWGHHAPAPIFGWSVLEALAHLAGGSGPARGLSPIQAVQAVQALAAEGYIENEDAQRLRGMARLRSAVVHGDFSSVVTADQVRFPVEQLGAMKSNIMTVAAEESAERVQRVN